MVTVTMQTAEYLGLCGSSDWIVRKTNHCLFLFSFKLSIFSAFTLSSVIPPDYFRNLPKSKVMERVILLPHVHTFFFFLEEQQKLLLLLCASTFRWSIAIFPIFLSVMFTNCTSPGKVIEIEEERIFLDDLVVNICHLYLWYSFRRCQV